jgi:hypothetical protein
LVTRRSDSDDELLDIDGRCSLGAFADGMLLQFAQDAFVADWLTNMVGLRPLFDLVYLPEAFEVKQLTLATVSRKVEFAVRETIHTRGTDEKIVPTTERTKVERTWPRRGRLDWVDVFLDVRLNVQTASTASPIDHITTRSLLDKVGPVATLAELKAKLGILFAPSVVEAIFKELRITSIEEFQKQPALFLEFVYQPPPVFDPADAANTRIFPLNVCVQVQETFAVREALQSAKLCRSSLENEEDYLGTVGGATVITPYAFVVIFPNALVADGTIPGLTAAVIKANVTSLYKAEQIMAFFA